MVELVVNQTVVELYRTKRPLRGQAWRFRTRAANGKVLTVSSEAYVRRIDAVNAIRLAHPGLRMVPL